MEEIILEKRKLMYLSNSIDLLKEINTKLIEKYPLGISKGSEAEIEMKKFIEEKQKEMKIISAVSILEYSE